jgi:hypothetical protein
MQVYAGSKRAVREFPEHHVVMRQVRRVFVCVRVCVCVCVFVSCRTCKFDR